MNKVLSPYSGNKMLKNIVLLLFVLFLYSKPAWSVGNCSETYSEDELTQRHNCAKGQTLTIQAGVEVRYAGNDKTVLIRGDQDDDDVKIENYGTLSGRNYTIYAHGITDLLINN